MEDKYAPLGGQAVIEGVLMRSPDTLAIAVRKPSNNEIILETSPVKKNSLSSLSKIPFVRGIVALIQSLQVGFWALNLSADIVMKDIEDEEKKEKLEKNEMVSEEESKKQFEQENNNDKLEQKTKISTYSKEKHGIEKSKMSAMDRILEGFFMTLSIVIAVGLFLVLPATIFNFLKEYIDNVILLNFIEGVIRITIFISYIVGISFLKDVKRLFEYHGAEHKTIHAYEAGDELTVENAKKYPTLHPRCGTNFLFLTAIISIVLFSMLGKTPDIATRVVSKLALLPFVAGISYELIRLAGQIKNKPKNLLVKIAYILSTPGILMQKLTTREPDDSQLEVGIISLKATLENKNFDKKEFQESLI